MNCEEQLEAGKRSILGYSEPIYIPNTCGPDLLMCPFCRAEIEAWKVKDGNKIMERIKHHDDCPWLWAVERIKNDKM